MQDYKSEGYGDEVDELDALLDSYAAEAAEQNRRLQEKTARSSKPRSMAAVRESGLQQPLGTGNKGYALLRKMGYQDGRGLGSGQSGPTQPLPLDLKAGRAGLGVDEQRKRERQRQQEQAELDRAKRVRAASETQQRFQAATRNDYAVRQALRHLYGAWRVVEQLDEREQQQQGPGSWNDTATGADVTLEGRGQGSDGERGVVSHGSPGGDKGSSGGLVGAAVATTGKGVAEAGPGLPQLSGALQRLLTQLPTVAATLADKERDEAVAGDSDLVSERERKVGKGRGGGGGDDGEQEQARVQAEEKVAAGGAEELGRAGSSAADAGGAAAGTQAPSVAEQLELLLRYLRERHCYCYFCGCQYDSEGDMASNCPGVFEDEH